MNPIKLFEKMNLPNENEDVPLQKIIVWGQDNLLVRAIDQILATRLTWDVTRMVNTDIESLFQAVNSIKPEVVVLCQVDMDDFSLAFQMIHHQPELRVITVGLENNEVNMFSRQNFILRGGSDFISVIEGSYLSNIPSIGGEDKETDSLNK